DHHRIVTGEEEVEEADFRAAEPELRVAQERLHAGGTAQVSRGDAVGSDPPRIRRHHGVMMGSAKKKTATAVMAPEMGRSKRMRSEPCDMMRLWRRAFSARSPRTRASTRGASG